MRKFLLLAIIPVLFCVPAFAQQAQQQQTAAETSTSEPQVIIPPHAQQPATAQKTDSSKAAGATSSASNNKSSVESNDRIFFALPNYGTVENAENLEPLTIKQKFVLQWRNTFDPVEFPYVGLLAGISQATNGDPGYGQGAAGYGKRYGAAFLDSVDENFMVGAIYPTLLKEDPRYYQMGKGGFFHRTGYSISRIFVTRTDSGKTTFNFSEILGSATAASIGSTYRVGDERHLGDVASDWATQVGWDTASNLLKEFWPDIRNKFRRNS